MFKWMKKARKEARDKENATVERFESECRRIIKVMEDYDAPPGEAGARLVLVLVEAVKANSITTDEVIEGLIEKCGPIKDDFKDILKVSIDNFKDDVRWLEHIERSKNVKRS